MGDINMPKNRIILLIVVVVLAVLVGLPQLAHADALASNGGISGGSSGPYNSLGADPPAISFTGVTTNVTDGTWSLGYEFSPNSTVDVTALGFYNANLTGGAVGLSNCTGCGEVGLYDSSGTLLVSGLVTSAGAQVGDFNYVSVPVTSLTAGQDYFLLGETGNADYTFDTTGLGIDPSIAWISELETYNPALTFTTTGESNPYTGWGIYGPNIELTTSTVTPTPEPNSLLMLIAGLIALLGVGFAGKRLRRSDRTDVVMG
jgi:hypothetical protein